MEGERRRKIMVAMEYNEESIYALEWAMTYIIIPATSLDSEVFDHLVILFIVPKAPWTATIIGKESLVTSQSLSDDDHENKQIQMARGVAERVRNMCEKHNISYEMKTIAGEEAKAQICKAANTLGVDLLAVGDHQYGGCKRLFSTGSVVDYCLQHAKCPVMVVKRRHYCLN
ncbi:universal stress protein PHOS32-like isoform X2 [Telopea speciosissima]|uniref:universal stress protein PHOS32-like isoform X2 n=1 Tax=Telopea speciosissima TaxID=54955 RepID=UPI001CC68A7F|nr:universal stress protein PHOS32-like isoform X2 [Telopea speciosissima]